MPVGYQQLKNYERFRRFRSKTSCSNGKGKSIKFNGKLPHWSNDDPGKGNLYTGQCTWYAYGMRQKKPVSTYWHDAHME